MHTFAVKYRDGISTDIRDGVEMEYLSPIDALSVIQNSFGIKLTPQLIVLLMNGGAITTDDGLELSVLEYIGAEVSAR